MSLKISIVRKSIKYYNNNTNSMYENYNKPNDALKLAVRKFVYSSYRIFKKLVEEANCADDIFTASQQLRDKLVLLSVDLENMFFQLTDDTTTTSSSLSLSSSQKQEKINEIEKNIHFLKLKKLSKKELKKITEVYKNNRWTE
jgi:hypothetical protein